MDYLREKAAVWDARDRGDAEADWTDPDTPGLHPCPRSKAIAERVARNFIQQEGAGTELVVVNPTFILGPTLTSQARSSVQLIKTMLDGTMTVLPRQRFGVADVRDVADLHIRAMATPEAAGRRFPFAPHRSTRETRLVGHFGQPGTPESTQDFQAAERRFDDPRPAVRRQLLGRLDCWLGGLKR